MDQIKLGIYTDLLGHNDKVSRVKFSPDFNFIASASFDETIKVWNKNSRELVCTLEGHVDVVTSIDFSPDGS